MTATFTHHTAAEFSCKSTKELMERPRQHPEKTKTLSDYGLRLMLCGEAPQSQNQLLCNGRDANKTQHWCWR